jgi:hypothetical protein
MQRRVHAWLKVDANDAVGLPTPMTAHVPSVFADGEVLGQKAVASGRALNDLIALPECDDDWLAGFELRPFCFSEIGKHSCALTPGGVLQKSLQKSRR